MTPGERPPLDSVYRCVAAERRQHVLGYFQGTEDGTASLDDLVDYVVEQETCSPPSDRESVSIDLYHVHLPMLADHGVVDFESRTEIVRYKGHEEMEAILGKSTIDLDVFFDVLSNDRRRFVLACLQEYATPMPLGDVADEVAVWERGTEITGIPAEEVKSIYTSLYHSHIPKMEDAGIVEYSQERDAVTLGDEGDELISILQLPTPASQSLPTVPTSGENGETDSDRTY